MLKSGTQLGPYEILSLLGIGGMGEVYRARDTRLMREVAIKILSKDSSSDETHLKYFEREARAASALNHPNIVTIYDIGSSSAFGSYIAMELIEGKTMRDLLAGGPVAGKQMLQLAAQVADGLASAHAAGIFHRDLKPENLIITKDGLVKILDFGLAKLEPSVVNQESQTAIRTLETQPGAILGTVGYMSPEQAAGHPTHFQSDQFSLGAILYEMATGRRAFQRMTPVETLSAIIRDEPEPVTAVNAKVAVPVRWIIDRCLSKNPEERYASTMDLARDLHDLRDHFSEVTSWDAASSLIAPKRAPAKRLRVLTSACVMAGIVLGVVIGALLTRSGLSPVPSFHPVTFGHGHITGARFAADGQGVVYGASWVGQMPQLYSTLPGNPAARSLGLNNAGIFSISSSGEMAIAYPCALNWGECMGTLALVPSAGGVPREILDNVHDADWAPDGKTLVVAQFAGQRDHILQYPKGNILYETGAWVRHVRVSPSGDRIAFFDHTILGDIGGSVCVLDLAGNKRVLSSGWKGLQGLAWSANGEEIWFTGSRTGKGGSLNLFAVNLSGSERKVFSTPGSLWITDISRDGRRALLMHGRPRAGMIGHTPSTPGERDLSWLDYSTVADLSSDGKTLLFYEWGNGAGGDLIVYLRGTDGSEGKKLGEGKPLALSPDGHWALTLKHTAPPQLVLLPTGLGKEKPLPRGPINEFLDWAAWSPDGGRIFFTAAEPGHRPRTYVQDIDAGLPQAVTPEGMAGTLLSPDGTLVLAVDRYQQYYICPIDGGEPSLIEGFDEGDVVLQWSEDGRTLFLRSPDDKKLKIYQLDLHTGVKKPWKEFTPPYVPGFMGIGADPGQVRISRDGESYVYTYWIFPGELFLAEGLK